MLMVGLYSRFIERDQGVDTVVSEPNAMNAYQQSLDSVILWKMKS